MLLLLLLVYHVFARDAPNVTNPITKHVDLCPDIGYFFRRDQAPNAMNPGPCYLCFCRPEGTATCWLRDDRRCDAQSYRRHHEGKRDTRFRRSPSALSDIFFRDATRELFNKQLPEQCKPFESSISDGCPPVDWCIGCTVCDCDANGRWDCHILSFCNDNEKRKKTTTKQKVQRRRAYVRRRPTQPSTRKPGRRVIKKSVPTNKKILNKQQNKKPKQKIPARKATPKQLKKVSDKPIFIKKNIATKKPVAVKGARVKKAACPDNNGTDKIAKQVVKQVMTIVRKVMAREMKKIDFNSKRAGGATEKIKTSNKASKAASVDKKQNQNQVKKISNREINKQGRRKREVMSDIEVAVTRSVPNENATVSSLDILESPTENPIFNISTSISASNNYSDTGFIESTSINSLYYKYSVDKDGSDSISKSIQNNNISNNEDKTQRNFNVMVTDKTNNILNIDKDLKSSTMFAITESNDLKFPKWSKYKILKEKHRELLKNTNVERIIKNNLTTNDEFRKNYVVKGKGKKIQRKLGATKKYNLTTIVNTNFKSQDENPSDNIYNIVKKLFKDLYGNCTNNKIETNPKIKTLNVIGYLKRFLNKIFIKKKHTSSQNNKEDSINKRNIIETLCAIKTCKVNKRNRMILKTKLKELNSETDKIMKIIRIIKGLLHLVEIPANDRQVDTNNTIKQDSTLKDSIQKLNAILKDTYVNENKSIQLSDTQVTQINYVKQNAKDFVQCMGEFVSTLNEIISLLTEHDRFEKNMQRSVRYAPKYKVSKGYMHVKKLKKLLSRYNLIQNTFMKNMYEYLKSRNFETKHKNIKATVSPQHNKDLNNNAVDNYSLNIIQNLRRLKSLAKLTNSNRRKRYIGRDDDTMDYLLILIEHLMKNNSPLDAAPVNDGIDLLIETIKNAPDIKQVKKKVLEYTPTTRTILRNRKYLDQNRQKDDSRSDLFISKEGNSLTLEDKNNNTDLAVDIDKVDEFTESVNLKKYDDAVSSYKEDLTEKTTELSTNVNDTDVLHNKLDIEGGGDDLRRYEVYNGDIEDEISLLPTMNTTASSEQENTAVNPVIQEPNTVKKIKYYNVENDISSNDSLENKTNLDWIELNYQKEIREFKELKQHTTAVPVTMAKAVLTTIKPIEKRLDNVSSITREIEDKPEIDVEDVMFRKQMDLLNSLDYATEKSEVDDSKYGVDERFIEDTYF